MYLQIYLFIFTFGSKKSRNKLAEWETPDDLDKQNKLTQSTIELTKENRRKAKVYSFIHSLMYLFSFKFIIFSTLKAFLTTVCVLQVRNPWRKVDTNMIFQTFVSTTLGVCTYSVKFWEIQSFENCRTIPNVKSIKAF